MPANRRRATFQSYTLTNQAAHTTASRTATVPHRLAGRRHTSTAAPPAAATADTTCATITGRAQKSTDQFARKRSASSSPTISAGTTAAATPSRSHFRLASIPALVLTASLSVGRATRAHPGWPRRPRRTKRAGPDGRRGPSAHDRSMTHQSHLPTHRHLHRLTAVILVACVVISGVAAGGDARIRHRRSRPARRSTARRPRSHCLRPTGADALDPSPDAERPPRRAADPEVRRSVGQTASSSSRAPTSADGCRSFDMARASI